MSWLGFGKKKKQKPEVVHKLKLDQLAKLGYTDRTKNLEQLKLYAGDVNLVIKDYRTIVTEQPQQEPKPVPVPKQEPSPQIKTVQPIISDQVAPPQQKQEPKQEPPPPQPEQKQEPSAQVKSVQPVISDQAAPPKQKQEEEPPPKLTQIEPPTNNTPIQETPETHESKEKEKEKAKQYQGAKISEPKLKAVQPIMPDMAAPKTETQRKAATPTMLFNLRGILSADIRQILLNIGEPQVGEIVFSNSISGDQFYHYIVVNPLLKPFNLSFGDEASYTSLVHQVELSYQQNGAVDIHNKPVDSKQDPNEDIAETKDNTAQPSPYEALKNNITNLISSDVRLLLLPYNVELAERFYAYSLNGDDLCKFDYDGICFATGSKNLSKDNWNVIVNELSLPQSQPFDISKWNKLQTKQESVIKQAKNIQQELQNLKSSKKNQSKTLPEKEEKAPPSQPKPKANQNNRRLEKQQIKQLNKIIAMEKQTDKFLPQNLQKLKQRQLSTLASLHDIASIINLDVNVVSDINASARRQSETDLQNYLKSGDIIMQKQSEDVNVSITPQALEQRQLELLSDIHKTRKRLEILAKQKGVSLEVLHSVKSKVDLSESEGAVDIVALNKQYDDVFASLAQIAESVQSTAKQYGVELESEAIDKHLGPMYDDLERKQNALIARIQFLNDKARMINPKAVEVNEDILHISRHAHRRTSSGSLHLAVPRSPGDSPSPQDHLPDFFLLPDTQIHEPPADLPRKHSRSPSLSAGITITNPVETEREANQVRQRRKSLHINSGLLSKILKQFDKDKSGCLGKETFISALKQINVEMDDSDMIILNDVSDGNGVNIAKVISFVEDQRATLQLKTCKQWNSFRIKIIALKK